MLINLLPHRKWAQARKRKNFANTLVMAALLGVILATGTRVWMAHQLTAQMAANSILKKEIAAVDGLLKITTEAKQDLDKLTQRETTLQDFQADRKRSAVWLQEVVENLPDGLYLTALKQEGSSISINGVARSNEAVFELLRQIASHGQSLGQAELIEVTDKPVTLDPLALTGMPFALRALLKSRRGQSVSNAETHLVDAL